MKVLTKGIYYHKPKATGVTALWHDCEEWGKDDDGNAGS